MSMLDFVSSLLLCDRCLGMAGQITFYFFHWTKGSPDDMSQGEWNGLTFWEQLDAGVPWTKTKKFLMVVPTVL